MELPGCEIVEILGRCGFATVYRARRLAVGRESRSRWDSRAALLPAISSDSCAKSRRPDSCRAIRT